MMRMLLDLKLKLIIWWDSWQKNVTSAKYIAGQPRFTAMDFTEYIFGITIAGRDIARHAGDDQVSDETEVE